MTLQVVTKKKLAMADQLVSEDIVLPETIDEYGILKTRLSRSQERMAPLVRQVTEFEKGMLKAVDEVLDPSEKFTLGGSKYEVNLTAQGKRTELTGAARLFEIIGMDLFLKLATVKVSDLKAYLNPDQLEEVTKSSYGIKRRVKLEKI